MNEENLKKISIVLNGIIFKKAELEDNFVNVYSNVMERAKEIELEEGNEFLLLLGDVGE